ncbi:MAG TPA: M48 family metallopeptidase [Thermoanaerobaculia bacterium]|nr:M48 family metallopeptidase [Thermoanaerobaculia bacterium]
MPVLESGGVVVPWEIRRSPRARRLRIVVTPGKVEVVLPRRAREADAAAFVAAKRNWILAKTAALRARARQAPVPQCFADGGHVLLYGREVPLRVVAADVGRSRLVTASDDELVVRVPRRLPEADRERAARRLVGGWLDDRMLADAAALANDCAQRLGARPSALRLGNQKTLWGSCSAAGVVRLNRRLLGAPRPVFDYVVVHELCHLVERNHGPRFWHLVATLMPDFAGRRRWLREHGVALG